MLSYPIILMALRSATLSLHALTASATSTSPPPPQFSLVADYSGKTFFDGFTAFTDADPTNGMVTYVDMATAAEKRYIGFVQNGITESLNAYIGVDYTSVTAKRDSVRLTSKATFDVGTIVVMDVFHAPSAFGSWPALWLLGDVSGGVWPYSNGAEIDVLEFVHNSSVNAVTLHTGPGCTVQNTRNLFQGELQDPNCNAGTPLPGTTGCSIQATHQAVSRGRTLATAGEPFNAQHGGVYVTVWTADGISAYLFSRSALPGDLMAGTPDPTRWTTQPLAHFDGGCDFANEFSTMRIITDQTFCGDWAGKAEIWESSGAQAATGTATCEEYVMNNPAAFRHANFEIASIRVFSNNGKMPLVERK
ncbi:hypothetical protein LTR53_017620 [Teratosphaeriaceae sp. CCFEE 6253]|nr:hypothetical protein LTR53_017620 [Teratosphaeriaceae sp. CCFEE 6253]